MERPSSIRRLWIALFVVIAGSFAILGFYGGEIYRDAPPVPDRVVTDAGRLLFRGDDIREGQAVWQSMGGQQVGSIWGHGAYLAPDWSADYLHREAHFMLQAESHRRWGASHEALDPERAAQLSTWLQREIRNNRYDAATRTLTVSEDRARAMSALGAYYGAIFGSARSFPADVLDVADGGKEPAALREAYAIAPNSIPDADRRAKMSAFFFWAAWAAGTERPASTASPANVDEGKRVTYTNNWPAEPLIGNRPTGPVVIWSVLSFVLLLAGVGGLAWAYAMMRRDEPALEEIPGTDPLWSLEPTPSMRATLKYFWVVAAMIVIQVGLGAVTAHYANDPSDGSQRVVANHLAVLAHGNAEPGSCDRSWEEAAVHGDAIGASTTTDVDGDGVADLCARSSTGLECALSNGDSFEPPLAGPGMSDEHGWDDASNWATIRMGDLDGDGRADVCARANAGIRCWLSDGAGFPTAFDGPALSDDAGWAHAEYYGTLRMADVNGDGRNDLCARSASDFRCYPSNGAGFDPPVTLADLSNANGWNEASRYGTIRMGDVDGDGLADVCARASAGMHCWRSLPEGGFGPAIQGPAWSDASGWGGLSYWSTIRLVDLDGDARADLCARAARGIVCHLSVGDGFGEAIDGPQWSDASGWADYDNASTIRFGDLDGDGALDVCARANAGIRCVPFDGAAFSTETIVGPELSDDAGWAKARHAATIRLVDVNADGRADLCARASAGMRCWPSLGRELSASPIEGPAWSDESGWGAARFYETLRAVTREPRCEDAVEACNGADDDYDGEVDEGCEQAGNPDVGAPPAAPQDPDGEASPGTGGLAGCTCGVGGTTHRGEGAGAMVALCVAALVRSRRRVSSR